MQSTAPAQSLKDGDTTSPTLLDQVRDWNDHPAWKAFFDRYDPMLRLWCRRSGLSDDVTDEVCQRVWIDLMARIRHFRYDPSRGFRGWLWRLYRSRAIDVLRKQQKSQLASLDLVRFEELQPVYPDQGPVDVVHDEDPEAASSILLKHAHEAQEAVRARVDPDTWLAFRMIAIDDQPVHEVAQSLGKKYAAVYNGYKRVDLMLRQEGRKRLAAIMSPGPRAIPTDRPGPGS
jgi:RNA polymerase sigma-70 factor (ECF subfamily)